MFIAWIAPQFRGSTGPQKGSFGQKLLMTISTLYLTVINSWICLSFYME